MHASRVRLDRAGARLVGDPTRIVIGNRFEGANVVRRHGWFWLFGSATSCCNGPLTAYGVFAGRSRSPFGPFLDRADRRDPYFESDPGFTRRPAMLDPLDWRHGWPTVRAGRGTAAAPREATARLLRRLRGRARPRLLVGA